MDIEIENHPLEPFLPANARLLMLGSFPPQKKRWSMDFYYPNLINDMWRIVGLLFFNNKDYFLNETPKAASRTTPGMQSHRHNRAKGNRYTPGTIRSGRTQGGRFL